jgi:hypothetical protein
MEAKMNDIRKIKHALIDMAEKRGWRHYESVFPEEEDVEKCKEAGECDFIDEAGNQVVLLGQTDTDEVWGRKHQDGDLLVAPYLASDFSDRASDDDEFEKVMFSVFSPIPDNYVGTVGVILD